LDTGLLVFYKDYKLDIEIAPPIAETTTNRSEMLEKHPELFAGFLSAMFLFSSELGGEIQEILLDNLKIIAKPIDRYILVFITSPLYDTDDVKHRMQVSSEVFQEKYSHYAFPGDWSGSVEEFRPFAIDLETCNILEKGPQYIQHCELCLQGTSCDFYSKDIKIDKIKVAEKKKKTRIEKLAKPEIKTLPIQKSEVEYSKYYSIQEEVRFQKRPVHRLLNEKIEMRISTKSVDTTILALIHYSYEWVIPRLKHHLKLLSKENINEESIDLVSDELALSYFRDPTRGVHLPLAQVQRLFNASNVKFYDHESRRLYRNLMENFIIRLGVYGSELAVEKGLKTLLQEEIEHAYNQLLNVTKMVFSVSESDSAQTQSIPKPKVDAVLTDLTEIEF
jgi:histone H3/H4